MKIIIKRRAQRGELICQRPDGSMTRAALGPNLPLHDLAHYVAERHFGLRAGFFGNVAAGYSLASLGEKAVIQSLGRESLVAEVLARAVGALATGACEPEGFGSLVNEEITAMGLQPLEQADARAAARLLAEFRELMGRYDALGEGDALELEFT